MATALLNALQSPPTQGVEDLYPRLPHVAAPRRGNTATQDP